MLRRARELRRVGRLGLALDYGRRAVSTEPESPEARKLLADILWGLARIDEAKREYATFLKLHPPYRADVEVAKRRLSR